MEEQQIDTRKSFFKKVKLSMFNVEKYVELSAEGVPRAINYLTKLVAILAIVICVGMIYETTQTVNKVVQYIENDFPDFSYQDGVLDVKSESPITIENPALGTIIVDTSKETQEFTDDKDGVLVLKNKVAIKNNSMMGITTYEYSKILGEMGITRFEKQDVLNYVKGTQMLSLYMSLGITLFIYVFIIYFINTFLNSIFISAFGYLTSILAKVKMRYRAVLNMSIYAITLSTLLNIIYVIINMFTDFEIQYFDVMYISVAVIYLIAAIFIIKADIQKKQAELMKIQEVEEQVKKELQEKEREEEEKKKEKEKEKEPEEKEEKKENKKRKKEPGIEPEGTSA